MWFVLARLLIQYSRNDGIWEEGFPPGAGEIHCAGADDIPDIFITSQILDPELAKERLADLSGYDEPPPGAQADRSRAAAVKNSRRRITLRVKLAKERLADLSGYDFVNSFSTAILDQVSIDQYSRNDGIWEEGFPPGAGEIHCAAPPPRRHAARSRVPAAISAQPARDFSVNCSWRKTNASLLLSACAPGGGSADGGALTWGTWGSYGRHKAFLDLLEQTHPDIALEFISYTGGNSSRRSC